MSGVILGLATGELGSQASLVRDGRLRAAAREERFTRQRLDPNLPRLAAEHCLRESGRPAGQLSGVVIAGDPADRFTRVLAGSLGEGFPTRGPAFVRSVTAWSGHHLWERDRVSRMLDVDPLRIEYRPRHRCLAAAAVQGCGVERAAVLVVDTVGEWTATAICSWKEGHAPEDLERIEYPHSLGLLSAAVAMLLGFRPWEGLGALWALAAWGRPTFASRFRRIVLIADDGTYKIAPGYLHFSELFEPPCGDPWTGPFTDLLGAPRDARRPFPFRAGEQPGSISSEDQRHADIAASLQGVVEEALLGLARRAGKQTGARHLCLGGVLAGNAAAVRRLRRESGFETVSVPPDPNGGASGAALLLAAERGEGVSGSAPLLFGGRAWPVERDLAAVARMDPVWWQRFRARGASPVRDVKLEICVDLEDVALYERACAELAEGRIVAWVEGAFESGAAGLGHRAVLCSPSAMGTVRRLVDHVTGGPAFAPLVLLTTAKVLPTLIIERPPDQTWLPATAIASPEGRSLAPGAVHADGTLRFLIVDPMQCPRLAALLAAWQAATGSPGLLHADLCEAADPPAASPADALLVFMRTEIDTLVLESSLVRKESP